MAQVAARLAQRLERDHVPLEARVHGGAAPVDGREVWVGAARSEDVLEQLVALGLGDTDHRALEVALVGAHEQAERRAAPSLELPLARLRLDRRRRINEVPVNVRERTDRVDVSRLNGVEQQHAFGGEVVVDLDLLAVLDLEAPVEVVLHAQNAYGLAAEAAAEKFVDAALDDADLGRTLASHLGRRRDCAGLVGLD